jgi:hypothetical protein
LYRAPRQRHLVQQTLPRGQHALRMLQLTLGRLQPPSFAYMVCGMARKCSQTAWISAGAAG